MKKTAVLCLFVMFCFSLYSQDFKEVKTGQDVIDNYITANGGLDNIKKTNSIEMSGNMSFMGSSFPIKVYTSLDYFYMNADNPNFTFTIAINMKENKGWQNMLGQVKDVPEKEVERNRINVESMLWSYYTSPEKYGITYKLMQNEKIGDADSYVVDFMVKDSVIQTVYYDTKSFHKLKQVKGKSTSEYSDIRNADNSGVYMGYSIKTNQGDITVSEYKFNTEFDTNLLKKPAIEK